MFFLIVITMAAADPVDAAARAAMKQSGASEYVDNLLKSLQNKYVSPDWEQPAAITGFILQCAIKQRLELKWEF